MIKIIIFMALNLAFLDLVMNTLVFELLLQNIQFLEEQDLVDVIILFVRLKLKRS